MLRAVLLCLAVGLSGCMAAIFGTAEQLNQISIGMPKDEVLRRLGPPKSTAAAEGIEYLQYSWVKTTIAANANLPEDYFVAIKGGRVSSYGQRGDFDSTKSPTRRIEVDQTVRQSGSPKIDLYTELKKLQELRDSGVLTAEEFDARKKKLLAEN